MNLIKFLRGIIRTHDDQYVSHGDDPRAIILDEMVALEDGEDFMKLSPRESDRVMKLTKKQESESHVKGEFTVTLRVTVDALDELGKYGFRKSFTGKTEQEFLDYLRESPEEGLRASRDEIASQMLVTLLERRRSQATYEAVAAERGVLAL